MRGVHKLDMHSVRFPYNFRLNFGATKQSGAGHLGFSLIQTVLDFNHNSVLPHSSIDWR